MLMLQRNHAFTLCALLGLLLSSCDSLFNRQREKVPLARVAESYLFQDDIAALVKDDLAKEDSTLFVTNYINNWASKQLLLTKSKINLPEEKLAEFDRLVSNYRADLYTRAYVEALVMQAQDTAVTQEQLGAYYEQRKENFKLTEKLVQLRFVGMSQQFLDREGVKAKIRSWTGEDKKYLDSIAVQFKKIHFNDSAWVSATRVIEEIPPLGPANEASVLKKSKFFELRDSLDVYLGVINNVLEINDTAPLEYVKPDIRQLILNKRRMDYVRKLETEIIDEAIKKNEFEL